MIKKENSPCVLFHGPCHIQAPRSSLVCSSNSHLPVMHSFKSSSLFRVICYFQVTMPGANRHNIINKLLLLVNWKGMILSKETTDRTLSQIKNSRRCKEKLIRHYWGISQKVKTRVDGGWLGRPSCLWSLPCLSFPCGSGDLGFECKHQP